MGINCNKNSFFDEEEDEPLFEENSRIIDSHNSFTNCDHPKMEKAIWNCERNNEDWHESMAEVFDKMESVEEQLRAQQLW